MRTALENGDMDAVKAWFASQGRSNMKAGRGTPDLHGLITRLEQEGVDVTEVRTAFENGDLEAVKAWLDAQRSERQSGAGPSCAEGKQGERTEISGACDRPHLPMKPDKTAD